MKLLLGAATLVYSSLSVVVASPGGGGGASSRMGGDHHRFKPPVRGLLQASKMPSTGEAWLSVSPKGAEVQPADFSNETPEHAAIMRHALERMLSDVDESDEESETADNSNRQGDYNTIFLDGSQTYYDDYSQAWRLLGFYIDCDPVLYDGNESGNYHDDDSVYSCPRYLLWAAYIDLDYAGGGIGEYQFYDRHTEEWSDTYCTAADGRCAKMDCHLPETNFKLLGFFKEPNYDEWMEQLFKHEGVCVWTDEEYYLMQEEREVWPNGCTALEQHEAESGLYYDLKPEQGGGMTLGLYTENTCTQDYDGSQSALEILKDYVGVENDDDREGYGYEGEEGSYSYGSDGNVFKLDKYIDKWNDAFDIFKICQPCRAYDLGTNSDLHEGEERQGGQNDDYNGDDANGGYFTCQDDAGYTNVNQCMKFKTHTQMQIASLRDVKMATQQGTILEVTLNGRTYGDNGRLSPYLTTKRNLTGLLVVSSLVFLVGCGSFLWVLLKKDESSATMKSPLMQDHRII